ncbi:MAG TPA: hypothetical protein VHE30_26590 [Polyangiaceae bacterium]|nr:hypothetical protein [Polyangiaceae bacterium]
MDAEKFDKVVLDLLYDELDELTRASAIRHLEQSGRAKALYSELRATREVGALPLVEPPDDLEAKILEAEERARAGRPLHQRLGTLVSIVAGYAMRPQLGMAAVLLLMVGSSLLFLRVRPAEPSSVQVTERGVPESEKDTVAVVPAPAAAVPGREDLTARRERSRTSDAPRATEPVEKAPTKEEAKAASAGLAAADRPAPAARAERDSLYGRGDDSVAPAPPAAAGAGVVAAPTAAFDEATGEAEPRDDCEVTLPRYEAALARAASQIERNRARWGAADCYARLGRIESARTAYKALLGAPAYADRAKAALAALPEPAVVAAAPASPSPKAAKAAPPEAPAGPSAAASATKPPAAAEQ